MLIRRNIGFLVLLGVLLSIALLLAACQGGAGPQGEKGPAGSQGVAGPQGSVGPAGAAGQAGPAGSQGAAGAAGSVGPAGASLEDINKTIDEKFAKYDGKVPLWAIQAGTAVRMRELTESFNLMWYAAQAGNWDFAGFEVYRADGQVKAVAVTRPARVPMLNAWAEPNLKALNDAVKAKGIAAFEKAYDNAIAGCNACHAASEGGGFPMKSIKVMRPTQPTYSNLDFKGQ